MRSSLNLHIEIEHATGIDLTAREIADLAESAIAARIDTDAAHSPDWSRSTVTATLHGAFIVADGSRL